MLPQLLDLFHPVSAIVPFDVGLGAGALTADYVSLKNYHTCSILWFQGIGTSGEDTTFTLKQAQAVAGTEAKDLIFHRYHKIVGTDLATVGQFTVVADNNAAALVIPGATQGIYVIEVPVREMDIANGFDCIGLTASDPGTSAAALVSCLFFLGSPKFGAAPQVSAIVD